MSELISMDSVLKSVQPKQQKPIQEAASDFDSFDFDHSHDSSTKDEASGNDPTMSSANNLGNNGDLALESYDSAMGLVEDCDDKELVSKENTGTEYLEADGSVACLASDKKKNESEDSDDFSYDEQDQEGIADTGTDDSALVESFDLALSQLKK